MEVFLDITELDERGLRRLAQSRGVTLNKNGPEYWVSGVNLSDDEAWDVISLLPQVQTLGGRGRLV